MDSVKIAEAWSALCRQSRARASAVSATCTLPEAVSLIASLTRDFCDLPMPKKANGLAMRQIQRHGLATLIRGIECADTWAFLCPEATSDLVSCLTQRVRAASLPTTAEELRSLLGWSRDLEATLGEICAPTNNA